MFESSNFLHLMQVSSRGFFQIYKYMEYLEFDFSFFLFLSRILSLFK